MAAGKAKRGPARSSETSAPMPSDPGGRLSAVFLGDVLQDWEEHGAAAITSVRTERPHDYLKLVTTLFPKEANAKVNALDELTDDQLAHQLAAILAQLAAAGADPRAGDRAATKAVPTPGVPAV